MDSVCLEGEAGEIEGLNWAGDDDGVEGPRNEASRLMKSGRASSVLLDVCYHHSSQTHLKNNFFQESDFLQLQWLVNAKLGHT